VEVTEYHARLLTMFVLQGNLFSHSRQDMTVADHTSQIMFIIDHSDICICTNQLNKYDYQVWETISKKLMDKRNSVERNLTDHRLFLHNKIFLVSYTRIKVTTFHKFM
jgi:hypothetical protein